MLLVPPPINIIFINLCFLFISTVSFTIIWPKPNYTSTSFQRCLIILVLNYTLRSSTYLHHVIFIFSFPKKKKKIITSAKRVSHIQNSCTNTNEHARPLHTYICRFMSEFIYTLGYLFFFFFFVIKANTSITLNHLLFSKKKSRLLRPK